MPVGEAVRKRWRLKPVILQNRRVIQAQRPRDPIREAIDAARERDGEWVADCGELQPRECVDVLRVGRAREHEQRAEKRWEYPEACLHGAPPPGPSATRRTTADPAVN